jgi:hypothetical protein
MPQDQNAQTGLPTENNPPIPTPPPAAIPQKPQPTAININAVLLPKKPIAGNTLDSARRADASVLFEQEQNATLPTPPKPVPLPRPPHPETEVAALQTYKGDIEKLVQDKNVSVVSIAAAESERRTAAQATATPPRDWQGIIIRSVAVGGGILFLLAAAAAIIYVTKPAPSVSISTSSASAPFINVDSTLAFIVPSGVRRGDAMNALYSQRQSVSLSLGLIARLYLGLPVDASNQQLTPLSVAQLFTILAPNAPAPLVRALDGKPYLLGLHAYDGNQPFLILQTDSYEQAFSGMLDWERYMLQDLSPFFSPNQPTFLRNDNASSTPLEPVYIVPGFVDKVVENQDTRALQNNHGTVVLLWSFINRTTLVVTTNEGTLREIISRLKNAPILPLP